MQASWLFLGCLPLFAAACHTVKEPEEPPAPVARTLAPVENTDMHDRNVELAQRAKDHPRAQLVWLGDSITQGWESVPDLFDREFGIYGPLNLGVSGDRTEHVLWRLASGAYDSLKPKVIVIMIGTNNTGHHMDLPADIAAGIKEILAELKRRFPKAKLALLAIFPAGEAPDAAARKNNDAVNALLPEIAKDAGAEWLNISRAFVDDKGVLSRELMPDFLHPSRRGYEVWANAIRDALKRWMQ